MLEWWTRLGAWWRLRRQRRLLRGLGIAKEHRKDARALAAREE